MKTKLLFASLFAAALCSLASSPAVAQEKFALISNDPTLCLDTGGEVALTGCTPGANSYHKTYYSRNAFVFREAGTNWCLDGSRGRGGALILAECNGSKAQDWWVSPFGQVQNQANGLCADVASGNFSSGARLVMWNCHGGKNQKFLTNNHVRTPSLSEMGALTSSGRLVQTNDVTAAIRQHGASLIATGGGNLIGHAGSNLIATGGGNLIATGGLN